MKKEKRKKTPVKPRWFYNALFSFLSHIILFFLGGFSFNRKELRKYKDGSVLIYNHFSNKDHYIISAGTNFRSVNYVIAGYFYYNKGNVVALKLVRAIRKEQFRPDLVAIRKIKKVIEQKGMVAIAPAGQVSIHGASPYISPSIVKLLRYCDADVIGLQIRGTHLRFPKWRIFKRKCKVKATFVTVIRKEELKTLSDDEIFKRVVRSIDINDYQDQIEMKRKIKTKALMPGIDSVLIQCPKCHEKYQQVVDVNDMVCKNCGNHVYMDQYGLLHPKTKEDVSFFSEVEWYYFQKEEIRKELEHDDYCLQSHVQLYSDLLDPTKLELVGEGTLTLTKTELFYEGTFDGKPMKKEFNLDLLTQLPFSPASHFQVPDLAGTYKFVPIDNINEVIEWVQVIDVMQEMRENQ